MNFIEEYWLKNKDKWKGELVTRFPPEPNAHLHLGHAKSICLNFGLAKRFNGRCHLRLDDTNPAKEDPRYIEGIKEVVHWLGFNWDGPVRHASDYFEPLYRAALHLIESGLAYVDFSDAETVRKNRGTLTSPGIESSYRTLSPSVHLKAFEDMRAGLLNDGAAVLRAKIDMASPNINLRDPVLFRIKHVEHANTGKAWCIYPSYDYAHPFSDGIEGIALSLCTLEFEDHRPLYDWVIEHCHAFFSPRHAPEELEFARLELDKGITSKRTLLRAIEKGELDGWDDPRLVTLLGLRRRGFTPSAIRNFCEVIGVSRALSTIPFERLEDVFREESDALSPRRHIVVEPVRLSIEMDATRPTSTDAPNHPKDEAFGTRPFKLSHEWYVAKDDVRRLNEAEPGFKRIIPGACIRLMHVGIIEIDSVDTSPEGEMHVKAHWSEKKPRATIHAVEYHSAKTIEVHEVDVMPNEESDPALYRRILSAVAEEAVVEDVGVIHAVRYGYGLWDSLAPKKVWIRTVGLKNNWNKEPLKK